MTSQSPTRVNNVNAATFSTVLINVLTSSFQAQIYAPLYIAIKTNLEGADEARIRELIRRLQSALVTFPIARAQIEQLNVLPEKLQPILQTLAQVEVAEQQLDSADGELIPLLESLRGVQDPAFRQALETIITAAKSLDGAKHSIEHWFNHQMESLTDGYRRNIQYLSLLIGFLMAFILNVDTLHLARTLWDDPALRQTLALTAEESLQSGALRERIDEAAEALTEAQTQAEATPQAGAADDEIIRMTQEQLEESVDRAEGTLEEILSLRLPIGWEYDPVDSTLVESGAVVGEPYLNRRNFWNLSPLNNPKWLEFMGAKLAGWILTMIAIAQGAPFWFDLLNRIARGNRETTVINVAPPPDNDAG